MTEAALAQLERDLARAQPPYPTCEELLAGPIQWVYSTESMDRLSWTLTRNGPMETAVWVNTTREDGSTAREPFYDAATGTYHAVAAMPVSRPRVSSVTVHVQELAKWEEDWEEMNWKVSCPDMASQGCAWGLVRGELRPVMVLGEPRPRNKDASIVVRPAVAAADGPDGGYVTIRDYVTAVHPWLMGLRSDILGSLKDSSDPPLPADTPLTLRVRTPYAIEIDNPRYTDGIVPVNLVQ